MNKNVERIIEEALNLNTVAARKLRHFDAIVEVLREVSRDKNWYWSEHEQMYCWNHALKENVSLAKEPEMFNRVRSALSAYDADRD